MTIRIRQVFQQYRWLDCLLVQLGQREKLQQIINAIVKHGQEQGHSSRNISLVFNQRFPILVYPQYHKYAFTIICKIVFQLTNNIFTANALK